MKKLLLALMVMLAVAGCSKKDDNNQDDSTTDTNTNNNNNTNTETLDHTSKASVLNYYNKYWVAAQYKNEDIGWTGDATNCNAGTVSKTVMDKTLQQINYFRAMIGVPAVTFSADYNNRAQKAVLIFLASGTYSHHPDSTSKCFTKEGDDGAEKSNLVYSSLYVCNSIMTGFADDGINTISHRRNFMYYKAKTFGFGINTKYSATYVGLENSDAYPANSPEFISWPTKGYIPSTLVFKIWSLSVPKADFSNATVEMTDASNNPVTLSILDKANKWKEPAITWQPSNLDLTNSADVTYHVKVSNVMLNGVAKTYSYDVIIFKP